MARPVRPSQARQRLELLYGEETIRNLYAMFPDDAPNLEATVEGLAQGGPIRHLCALMSLFVNGQRRTETELAARFERWEKKLDELLARKPADDLPPQLRVRVERHHKELCAKVDHLAEAVERLAQAAEQTALNSDTYSAQAVGQLAGLKREVRDGLRDLHEAIVPAAPRELAVGEESAPLALVRTAA